MVAGIFGTIAAGVTLFVGRIGTAVHAEGAPTIVALRMGGMAFSFLTIILGVIAMGAGTKLPSILLIICAILSAILGGTLVVIFMVLTLTGCVLAI